MAGKMNTQKARARVLEISRELDAVEDERCGLLYGKSADNVTKFDLAKPVTPRIAARVLLLGIRKGLLVAELRKIKKLAHKSGAHGY